MENNGVITRLQEFALSKGGFAEFARIMGKSPTKFYNLVRRNAKPSVETLEEIAGVYSDLDLNYIITGTKKEPVASAHFQHIEQENIRLNKSLKELDEKNQRLRSTIARYETMIDLLLKQLN